MIFEKTKFDISKQFVNPKRQLKNKKKMLAEIFDIFECPKTHLIKALNSLDSSRPYGRLSENQKTGDSRELFLTEIDF